MAKVYFKNEKITVEINEGEKIIEAVRKAGLFVETPCNCMGICAKCKVKAVGYLSEKSEIEKTIIEENVRLACISRVLGDVEVELLGGKGELKTINRGYSIESSIDSDIKEEKFNYENKSSIPMHKIIDYKLLKLSVLKKLGKLESKNINNFYGIVFNEELIDIRENSTNIYGVAVDIGTTGLSSYLVDLKTGEVLNKVSDLNPQTEFGGDVISRITYCMEKEEGIDILSKVIREKVNSMIGELLEGKISREDVFKVIISANTTMIHLFLGITPDSIARAPYRAVLLDKKDFNAKSLSIDINEEAVLTVLPSASGYVGADIVSGVVAVDFQNKNNNSIFIDIGTNGEIVVNSYKKLAGSSTAAGPALEGMNISCGTRAEDGAIESFNIDEEFNITFETIGNKKAKGICGSGLIDIAAALVRAKVIEKSGKFNKDMNEKLKNRLIDKKFYITEEVYVSQKDIRQIQLAKGAIGAGITMLLKELNIKIEEIDKAVIAGAFGYHVNPESIKTIGLIPKGFKGEISFVGNSSVEGARLALINEEILRTMTKVQESIKVVELSTKDDFQNYFIKELNF